MYTESNFAELDKLSTDCLMMLVLHIMPEKHHQRIMDQSCFISKKNATSEQKEAMQKDLLKRLLHQELSRTMKEGLCKVCHQPIK